VLPAELHSPWPDCSNINIDILSRKVRLITSSSAEAKVQGGLRYLEAIYDYGAYTVLYYTGSVFHHFLTFTEHLEYRSGKSSRVFLAELNIPSNHMF